MPVPNFMTIIERMTAKRSAEVRADGEARNTLNCYCPHCGIVQSELNLKYERELNRNTWLRVSCDVCELDFYKRIAVRYDSVKRKP